MSVAFVQLNAGWNAEPNAPEPRVLVDGPDLLVRFFVNAFRFPEFEEGDEATLRFVNVERYRMGSTNDEGWYMGQCRFSRLAPAWGEFYEIAGEEALLLAPKDWHMVNAGAGGNHYLFYFRDETFECVAKYWSVELPANKSLDTETHLQKAASRHGLRSGQLQRYTACR